MHPLLYLLGIFATAILFLPLIKLIPGKKRIDFLGSGETSQTKPQSHYSLAPSILTPTERAFLTALSSLPMPGIYIAPKVRLADIFTTKHGRGFYRAFNQISAKHVDFLLIDDLSAAPLIGIELDDYSHQRADRKARDAFVDETFAATDLPLLHIPVQATYDTRHLEESIQKLLRR